MSVLLKKLLSHAPMARPFAKMSLIDSLIAGSFLIGAIGLGLIWWYM